MNLEALINALIDGRITPEERDQLEARLREDWEARRLYLELTDLHSRLLREPVVGTGAIRPEQSRRRPGKWIGWMAGLAATILAMSFAGWLLRPHAGNAEEQISSGVAMLGETLEAEFADGNLRSGDTLAPGPLLLHAGLARIEFFSGATLLVEGQAEIEVVSAWEVRCHSGRIRVRVPPAAKGFLVQAPDMKIEDLGTEFALSVAGGASEVHVFDGEVIAHRPDQAPASLTEGMSIGRDGGEPTPDAFLSAGDLAGQRQLQQEERFSAWQEWIREVGRDSRVIASYPMQRLADDRWDRLVRNEVEPRVPSRAGGAVGANWTEGRWPLKDALEFKRPGDRVRLRIEGSYDAITLACWVKVDSVDKKYNSLLLTDGYENGEPHWQIHEDGSLMFSIIYRPESAGRGGKWNQMYFSRPVFTAESLGRWHHLAVTYDGGSGEVVQYFDGKQVGREVSPLHVPGREIVFGACEIGNWGLPTDGHQFPVRNLNGAIDEFILYGSSLGALEIQAIFEKGRPQ